MENIKISGISNFITVDVPFKNGERVVFSGLSNKQKQVLEHYYELSSQGPRRSVMEAYKSIEEVANSVLLSGNTTKEVKYYSEEELLKILAYALYHEDNDPLKWKLDNTWYQRKAKERLEQYKKK